MTAPSYLTESESKLIKDAREGNCSDYTTGNEDDPANGHQWCDDRTISAWVIRDLLLGTNPKWSVAGAVWIKGAKIVGTLDLMGAITSQGLRIESCCFTDGLVLTHAELPFCSLKCCNAAWFVAQQLRTRFLSLAGTKFSSIIDLGSARIAGNLSCEATGCGSADEVPAFNAQHVRVEGSVQLNGLGAVGSVCKRGIVDLSGAIIDGTLSFDGAAVSNTVGDAIVAESIKVGASIFLTNARFCGAVTLASSKIEGAVFCFGSRFVAGRTGVALVAGGIQVGGSVQLGPPTGGNAPSGTATCYVGQVLLPRAKIGDHLDCDQACFMSATNSPAAASARNAPREILLADGIEVRGAVRFRGASICGEVAILNARIGGDLDCSGAKFFGAGGLIAQHATVGGRFLWTRITLNPATTLDLLDAQVSVLADDKQSWPSKRQLKINGLVYDRLGVDSPIDPASRLEWLSRLDSREEGTSGERATTSSNLSIKADSDGEPYTQPYRQLAKVLRDENQGLTAQLILVGLARRQWNHRELPCIGQLARFVWRQVSRPIGSIYRVIGYGYRPLPGTISLAVAIVLVGWLLFHFSPVGAMDPATKEIDPLSPFWYSLDVFLPTHPLHQVDHWWPKVDDWRWCFCLPHERTVPWGWLIRVWLWFETLSGWVLTGLFGAGITGIVRRE